jgi:hypothetical protein
MIQEKINFEGWPNCIRLTNKNIELIVTTDVGPRILKFGFINSQNLLYISQADKGKSGGDDWRIYGGHRLWHSPEVLPRTYSPDNKSVNYSWDGKTLKLTQDIEPETSIIKEIQITLSEDKNEVEIRHLITNKSCWDVELAPWAITACAGGGRIILPQEPYIDPADNLLPSRPLVLWHYTQMNDQRFVWGGKYIQIKHDSTLTSEQKIGILNKQGWCAYILHNNLFIKHFKFDQEETYADYGCNNEAYVNGDFLEIESLGPLTRISPGEMVEHPEKWSLHNINPSPDDNEQSLEKLLQPYLNRILVNK